VRRALVAAAVVLAAHAADAAPDAKKTSPTTDAGGLKGDPGDRRIVGILDVRVEGLAPDVAAQFEKKLEQQIDTKRFWLATRARMKQSMANSTRWTEGCVIGTCLREVRAQTHAELVLIAALSGSGTSFGFVVTLVRTDTGRVLAQEAGRCDVCTIAEAMNQGAVATVRILRDIPAMLPNDDAVKAAQVDLAIAPFRTKLDDVDHRWARLGTTMAIVGVIATGAGLALYFINDHADYGLGIAGVGAGLTIGGVVVLTF